MVVYLRLDCPNNIVYEESVEEVAKRDPHRKIIKFWKICYIESVWSVKITKLFIL